METLNLLMGGFAVAFTPTNLALAVFGAFIGTLVGALPGLGPANGVAILVPLAFTMGLPAESALILMASVYYGAMYGGRISSIMMNIPGDEPAVITTLDGYPMAKQGKAESALAISAVASFVGATLATIGLMIFAPLLADFAIRFGPAEYFALYVLAFSMLASLSGANPIKTLIATCIGLMLSTVGLDHGSAVPRFTFGHLEMYEGIDFIVAIVGLFAISELLLFLENTHAGENVRVSVGKVSANLKESLATGWAMLRGSVVGFIAGVLPGAGASLGSFLSYTVEKRYSNKDDTFGKGDPRGVAAPEAGNNAAAGGALVPMLSLGVPGSGTTAVLLAVLISMNITPGPLLFAQRPDVVWGLIASLYVANVVLLVLNLPLVGIFVRLLSVPVWILMPIVAMVAFVGVYSISHSVFDIVLMVAFGLIGYLLRKMDISLVPIILGLLLGSDMETNLRRALNLSDGDVTALFASPLSISLWVLAIAGLVLPFVFGRKKLKYRPKEEAVPD